MYRNRAAGILCLSIGLLAGCAVQKYHPAPVSPAENATALASRSLTDPGLSGYIKKNLGNEALGNEAAQPNAWDLNRLTLAAFYFNPELAVARARLEAAAAAITSAKARPNPTVTIAPGGEDAPESPWLFGFGVDWPIETAGKRRYRIARETSLYEAAQLDLASARWRVRSQLRTALVDHLIARRELDNLNRQEPVLSERVGLLEARLAVGEIPRPEVDAAQIELSNTRLALHAAEGRVATSRAALAAAIGLPVEALDGLQLEWPDFAQPPNPQLLTTDAIQRDAVLNRLDVRRALADYAAADATLRLELAKQYPNLSLGPAYNFDEGFNKYALGAGLTLPVLNRNQGPIAEAEARRKEAGARLLATQAQVIAESERARAQYAAAEREFTEATQTLTQLQSTQEQFARAALRLGESDRLRLNGVLLQSAAATTARLNALRRVQGALGALEDAVQRPLEPPPPGKELRP